MFLGCSLNFIHAYGCLERIPNAQSLAKEPSRSFGEQTNQFVTLLIADLDDLVYLSCIAWSQLLLSCVQHPASDLQFTAEGCSCAVPSADTTPELTVKGKRAMARLWLAHKSVLPEPKANHTVAHLPHRQIYVLQECAGNIWKTALSAMVCIWR